MTLKFIPLFAACLLARPLAPAAQDVVRCATREYTEWQKSAYPELRAAEESMNRAVYEAMYPEGGVAQRTGQTATVITVPVVVHVVYNTSTQNISYNQVKSQIDVLNQDFGRNNSDTNLIPAVWKSVAANTEIQFCLAARKPNGDWTDGIERRQTGVAAYSIGGIDSVKFYGLGGLDAWDPSRYLNIWVLNFANGVLGVTQMPLAGPASTDGLCVHYSAFGKGAFPLLSNYNKGRTTTHEVGHWLGLFHIWGDDNGTCSGTDSIADTPNQAAEHYTCQTFPSYDSCSPAYPGTMWMNYMDYTYDRCMYMFTQDQKTRMNTILATVRSTILTSDGCVPAIGIAETELANMVQCFPNPASGFVAVDVSLPFDQEVGLEVYDAYGRLVFEKNLGRIRTHRETISTRALPAGLYSIRTRIHQHVVSSKVLVMH